MKRCCIVIATWISFCWLTQSMVLAQHLPENKIAKGNADTVLSGIDVYKSTVKQAVAKFGNPSKVIDIKGSPDIAGGREYHWQRCAVTMEALTWNDAGDDSVPYSVEVTGSKPCGQIGQTGRRLKLGATLSDVQRIYGSRYVKSRFRNGTWEIIVQWEDETTLYLYLDKKGRINRMNLMASIE